MTADNMVIEKENVIENRYASTSSKPEQAAATSSASEQQAHVFSPELLSMYYSRLFPFELLHSWLAYDPAGKHPQLFSRREFSFTIEPVPGEEIYIRYQSFAGQQELQDAVCKRRPHKIDIGAIFSHPPKDKNTVTNFATVQRELVFDIDLTDYDEVRHCGCSGAKICGKCWTFMNMAVKVMDQGLKEDFGFERLTWFYSGRRGVHCWVCDESARELSNEARSSVAQYFEVNLGGKKDEGLAYPLHPMLARAYKILEPMFIESVLPASGHGLLANEELWEGLLNTLPSAARQVRDNLMEKWSSPRELSTPEEKWDMILTHLDVLFGTKKGGGGKMAKHISASERGKIENWPVEAVFKYTYPRLDINVSKMQNHLLKSPFCVHPKTGRVCVPIQVESIEEFDPFQVPTLPMLMKELDEFQGDDSKIQDWQKTSLKAYFEPFQKEFLNPLLKELRRKDREAAEEQAAMIGDF